jgi:hypothetical protein
LFIRTAGRSLLRTSSIWSYAFEEISQPFFLGRNGREIAGKRDLATSLPSFPVSKGELGTGNGKGGKVEVH